MSGNALRARLLGRVATFAILGISAVAPVAHAQTAGGVEEITVTAQKRAENIQNVPIAITAFSGTDLQQKGVTDLHQLSNLTPNVNLDAGSPFSGATSVL